MVHSRISSLYIGDEEDEEVKKKETKMKKKNDENDENDNDNADNIEKYFFRIDFMQIFKLTCCGVHPWIWALWSELNKGYVCLNQKNKNLSNSNTIFSVFYKLHFYICLLIHISLASLNMARETKVSSLQYRVSRTKRLCHL